MVYKMSKLWDCKYTIKELLEGNEDELCLLNINYDRHWSDDNIGTMVILLKKKDTENYIEIGMFEDGLVYLGDVSRVILEDCIETTMRKAYSLLTEYVKLFMDRLNLESEMLKMGIEESCPNIVFKNGYELEKKNENKKLHADRIDDKIKYLNLVKRNIEREVKQYKTNTNSEFIKVKTECKLKMFLNKENDILIPINEYFKEGISFKTCLQLIKETQTDEDYQIDIEYLKDKDIYYNSTMSKLIIKEKGSNEVLCQLDSKSVLSVSQNYYSIALNIEDEKCK